MASVGDLSTFIINNNAGKDRIKHLNKRLNPCLCPILYKVFLDKLQGFYQFITDCTMKYSREISLHPKTNFPSPQNASTQLVLSNGSTSDLHFILFLNFFHTHLVLSIVISLPNGLHSRALFWQANEYRRAGMGVRGGSVW